MSSCPGSGLPPRGALVCQPENARDLTHGRAVCSACPRTLALTLNGKVRHHKLG